MKNISFVTIRILALFFFLLVGSCKDPLEEISYSFISPEQVEDSPEGLDLWMNGVRSTFLKEGFFRYEIFNRVYEMDSDDVTGPNWFFKETGAGNFANNVDIQHLWTDLYLLINRANYVIPFLQQMQNVEPEEIDNAVGELNFYKAWAYFLLVRAFGELPLYKTSVVENGNTSLPRSSVSDVYGYIVEVLKDAETQLYSRSEDEYEAGKISQEAAKTLLAKVYLTMASGALAGANVTVLSGPQKNSEGQRLAPVPMTFTKDVVAGHEGFNASEYFLLARDKAKEVIDVANPGYISGAVEEVGLFDTWNNLWDKDNKGVGEHLWMVYSEQGIDDNGMVLSYHYSGLFNDDGLMLQGSGVIGLTDHWYELFETKDRRVRDGVIHQFAYYNPQGNPIKRWYPRKEYDWAIISPDSAQKFGYDDPAYKPVGGDQGIARVTKFMDVSDNTLRRSDAAYPFLRYAETLLIYAEASNEVSGPTSESIDAINLIRKRSEATEIVLSDFDQQRLRSFILEERRRELALEGNRSWDIRRWGIYLQVMNAQGGADINNINKDREPRHLLFAMPIVEITGNTEVDENNQGW